MLTQAATCFSISWSARRSAAARSGRLVKTSRVLIPQSFSNRGVAQADPEHALQARVVEAPRLLHERQQGAWDRLRSGLPGDPGRPRQRVDVGDKVEPVAHLHL